MKHPHPVDFVQNQPALVLAKKTRVPLKQRQSVLAEAQTAWASLPAEDRKQRIPEWFCKMYGITDRILKKRSRNQKWSVKCIQFIVRINWVGYRKGTFTPNRVYYNVDETLYKHRVLSTSMPGVLRTSVRRHIFPLLSSGSTPSSLH